MNADAPWEGFDPHEYVSRNYLYMQPDDEEIISQVRDHFSDHFQGDGRGYAGIDVGAGGNLYPALAMLPWTENITLLERSRRNLNYLRGQCDHYDPHWDQFWDVLCREQGYARLGVAPRERLRKAAQVEQGDLFDLGDHPGRWDLGTMFFVAESITASIEEFRRGVSCFMGCLRPGAPFAAAFMANSAGYRVGDVDFPACDIGETEVEATLRDFTRDMKVYPLRRAGGLVRDGYTGMLLVCGHRNE
ncbi:SCO2525 family SAM-dependent methyltransferase [Streptomyces sp. NBC_01235]|nr:SCO2525 family SAM-dependent methyltransferase [Streptomyces sp. NBC_01235]